MPRTKVHISHRHTENINIYHQVPDSTWYLLEKRRERLIRGEAIVDLWIAESVNTVTTCNYYEDSTLGERKNRSRFLSPKAYRKIVLYGLLPVMLPA